jgi:fructosamine-3-kinase
MKKDGFRVPPQTRLERLLHMTHNDELGMPQVRFGPIKWLSNPLRTPIEEAVSEYRGGAWKMRSESDLSEFACHHCAIVSDGSFAVFFKYSEAVESKRQFEVELSGLQTLSKMAEVLIPRPIGIVPLEGGTLLIMEALEVIKRGPCQWRQLGTTLACIHRVKGVSCGFETNGFCGPFTRTTRQRRVG